jgi:membrane fusion protein, multidrug efflux system
MDARRNENVEQAARGQIHIVEHKEVAPDGKAGLASRKKLALVALVLCLISAGGFYSWRWWSVGRFMISTDNAFLNADKVTIAPQVGGAVAQVFVTDHQAVRRGDVLALIDDREYRVALAAAKADADKAQADLEGVGAALAQQLAQIESVRADLTNAEAALTFAQQEFGRYQDLLKSGAGSVQREQQAEADLRQRRAASDKAKAALDAAQKQSDSLMAQQAGARATLDAARARVDQAKLNLDHTRIIAPIDGVVGDRALRLGQYVVAGASLLTLVPMGADIYLVANFKETQTATMKVGQEANFTLDAFGDHVFRGRVASFAPGTGAQFALLPPDNATGNFTRIVQRVPVRIAIDASDPLIDQLRPGLSAAVTVDARPAERETLKQVVYR